MSMKKSAAEGAIRVSSDIRGVDVEVPFKTKRRCSRAITFVLAILFRFRAHMFLTRVGSNKKTPHSLFVCHAMDDVCKVSAADSSATRVSGDDCHVPVLLADGSGSDGGDGKRQSAMNDKEQLECRVVSSMTQVCCCSFCAIAAAEFDERQGNISLRVISLNFDMSRGEVVLSGHESAASDDDDDDEEEHDEDEERGNASEGALGSSASGSQNERDWHKGIGKSISGELDNCSCFKQLLLDVASCSFYLTQYCRFLFSIRQAENTRMNAKFSFRMPADCAVSPTFDFKRQHVAER
jgi:hypothetical protein